MCVCGLDFLFMNDTTNLRMEHIYIPLPVLMDYNTVQRWWLFPHVQGFGENI